MKRIEFTPGIEAMRGSFSPKQKLQYALHNNPAFDAPVGRQYARNYRANFVGAKRSATGQTYFFTKTKSATLVTPASKLNMALNGGVGAIYAAILNSPTMLARLQYAWKDYFHSQKTFRAFMDTYLRDMLSRKATLIQIGRDAESNIITIGNPWNMSSTASYIPAISNDVLVKFWVQLGSDGEGHAPIYFAVDGRKGIAFAGDTFQQVTGESKLNVLGLEFKDEPEDMHIVTAEGAYVTLNGVYAEENTAITVDGKYTTTVVAPA